MPAQKTESGMFAKYGQNLDKAVQEHRNDDIDYGFIKLPPGIVGGIAKLTDCALPIYVDGPYKGEYFFRAQGTVTYPESVLLKDGHTMKVAGLQTSIMEAVCNTKTQDGKVTSQSEHVANILNEMGKLAGKEFVANATGRDLELLAAQLKQVGPCFRFSH